MSYDVIIVGAGPGGLACAAITAENGLKTLVVERKTIIGTKVCAGGVTWNGLVQRVPAELMEGQWPTQHVFTRLQKFSVSAKAPIIATVNRQKLGRQMAEKAQQAGAEIRLGCQVRSITDHAVTLVDKATQKIEQHTCTCLVGADGSSSLVRRHLGIPVAAIGIGINYQLPGSSPRMEWHLDSRFFAGGYGWVFPHRQTTSIGAYVDARVMKARDLQKNLLAWGEQAGHALARYKAEAGNINFDYRGYRFDNTFLVGDAAGLASALTGEGIYPAIVSGEEVARCILDAKYIPHGLQRMIKNHHRHRKMVTLLGKSPFITTLLAEALAAALRVRLLDFSAAEMAR